MPRDENVFNDMLFRGVSDRNFDLVTAALLAGANVNGPRGRDFPPIVAATVAGHAGMVNFLLGQGADPGRPVTKKVTCPSFSTDATTPGERALHIAARRGNVEIVRLLLKRAGTDLDATDNEGCTPLMAACKSMLVCGEVVRLLLEAGADPALAVGKGFIPLQVVAYRGLTDLVDMLHSRAPSTLNACTATGKTPLSFACSEGHARTVSKLLSLGAMHPKGNDICPLSLAVEKGSVDVVRVLIKEGDVRVATDKIFVMPRTLYLSIVSHRARILRLLLMVDGEEKRWEWANKVMNCATNSFKSNPTEEAISPPRLTS